MDGVVLADKPAGKTSHDVVAALRRTLSEGTGRRLKVGHAGTLDPFATGLLIVLVGRATRAQRFLMALPKTYQAVARFGAVSTTADPEGQVVETGGGVPGALELPTGELRQRPPAHSAVKVGGERAYRRARRGEQVDVPERTVTVHEFTELWRDPPDVGLRIVCSAGTYVRSLIADLGDAYCLELRRTAIGPFSVAEADPQRVVGLAEALGRFLPTVALRGEDARRAAHGLAVAGAADGPVLLVDEGGPVAVAEPRGAVLKPTVGFRG